VLLEAVDRALDVALRGESTQPVRDRGIEVDLAKRIYVVLAPAPKQKALGLDLHAAGFANSSAIRRCTCAPAAGPEAGSAGREAAEG
jgi:hypothetical protein